MLLRPRQKMFVERSVSALNEHGNTLGVAPTGAGKTIMLSALAGRMVSGTDAKACVLAHRDELPDQNRAKFAKINPNLATSVIDASQKSWDGQVAFAMVPTLARAANLDAMPALDLLVIDEAHHAVAASYRRIVDHALQRNSATTTYAFGAVQNRSDGRDKADVRDTALGLAFIEALRPVDFRWDMRVDYDAPADLALPAPGARKRTRFHHGFITQDVAAVIAATGTDFGGYQDHAVNGARDVQSLGYTEFIAPLVRAVQELSARHKTLEARVAALEGTRRATASTSAT